MARRPPLPTMDVDLSESRNTDALSWTESGMARIISTSRVLPCVLFWRIIHDVDLVGRYLRTYHNISDDGIARRGDELFKKWASDMVKESIVPGDSLRGEGVLSWGTEMYTVFPNWCGYMPKYTFKHPIQEINEAATSGWNHIRLGEEIGIRTGVVSNPED